MKTKAAITYFPVVTDERGSLVFAEVGKHLDFSVERFFFIYGANENIERGGHAHVAGDQYHICVSGNVTVVLDYGKKKEEMILSKRNEALRVRPMVWHTMKNFSPDCVLLVVTSNKYAEKDYIRDYNDFLEILENTKYKKK